MCFNAKLKLACVLLIDDRLTNRYPTAGIEDAVER
jgi:hypothetical protein